MRVADLDRDMRDVIPTGTTRDSEFLFRRMTEATLSRARPEPGRRILDVASGMGQDALDMARSGAQVIGVEPSARMTAWAQLQSKDLEAPLPGWVRGWSDALPFASRSFDAALCKGALDHFDRPLLAISEMARVTKLDGTVVLAIANFESFACRTARNGEALRQRWLGRAVPAGRRAYDVPSDHFTRYDLDLAEEQAGAVLELDLVEGVSMAWGLSSWAKLVAALPESAADLALSSLDWMARRLPGLSDVLIVAGRPKPHTA